MNKSFFGIILFIFISGFSYSQQKFAGRVYDKNTKEPLAFVNIVYNSQNLGTTTDLNGYFTISNRNNIEFFRVTYLGYITQNIEKQDFIHKEYYEIFLEQDAYRLDEVVVIPGENPAHRIINEVIANADKNNPEKMTSFSFMQYSKMIFTIDFDKLKKTEKPNPDSITNYIKEDEVSDSVVSDSVHHEQDTDTIISDTAKSGIERMREFFDYQHLFITESVSERRFRYPDNNKEEVLAHRISGLQNPGFTLLTSQLQSFSFYDEFISILDYRYVNPINRGSTRRYFFLIEDTMYNERADTIFIISFRPRKGANFDGLKGVLHINSNNYAIQNVRARPFEPTGSFDIVIQQKYQFIDEKQWFPVQLNTEIIMNFLQGTADGVDMPIIGIGRSYISDISLDPDFKRRDFNHITVHIKDDAHKQTDDIWERYRVEPLSQKDLNTYRVIDSLGKEINLDRIMEYVEIAATGYIPIKFVNIDPSKIMWYNEYEGYRLGLGAKTNHKLLPWMSLGGYFAYGFRDKAWKYGGETEFFIHRPSSTALRFGYRQDLKHSDSYSFNKPVNFLSNENLQQFFISQMDSVTEYYAGLRFNTFRYLNADIVLKHSELNIINADRYFIDYDFFFPGFPPSKQFLTTELGFYLRYAHKERFFQTPKGNRISMGTKYPILYFNYIRGLSLFGANYEYQKFEAQIYKKFETTWYGDTHITLTGGMATGNIPYTELYYGQGTYSYLNVDNTFNTMRPHEFISQRFANIHIRHDFGSLIFRTDNWHPRFILTTSAGWGDSQDIVSEAIIYPEAKFMDQGYFESGFLINNIIKVNFTGLGVGVYYRYGPYSFTNELDNFAFKISGTIVL